MKSTFEVWDGDVFLFYADTQYEADELSESGFTIKEIVND